MYQGVMDGQAWSFPGRTADGDVASPRHPTQLISEIWDAEGRLLYEARAVPRPMADPGPGRLVGDILRNVVRWGTGRRALASVTIDGAVVPVAGKTGTTNGYRNAAFAGFVPKASADGWRWAEGFTLVSYVGNDDNTPMRRRAIRLQGSNGALPVWMGAAQGLADAGLLGAPPDEAEEWIVGDTHTMVPVEEGTGLPGIGSSEEGRGVLVEGGDDPVRRFSPVGLSSPLSDYLLTIRQDVPRAVGSDTGLTPP